MELWDIPEDPWRIRLIRGHVGQDELFLKTTLMSITMISRKAALMGGIIDTGIDDDGSVANFVETEHIIEINKNLITFTATRGSVPWFWDRINEKLNDLTDPYDIEIQREFEMHETAFKLHIKDLIESYHKVVLVNLLDSLNNYELALIKFYEFLLKKYKEKLKSKLKYIYWNYKKELINNEVEDNISIKTALQVMKFNWMDSKEDIISRQSWVMRINSLNCLHRSNKFQQKIAVVMMKHIFAKLDEKQIITKDKIDWSNFTEKLEKLYQANGAKLCIESGCHWITNNKPEEKGYLATMYSQVTSIEKYFTNYLTSIQTKEDNLYQEALGNNLC